MRLFYNVYLHPALGSHC